MVDDVDFYNPKYKKGYLEIYPQKSQYMYANILKSIKRRELLLKKDLKEFTIEEIEELMHSFKLKTKNSVHLYTSVIKTYIDFTIYSNFRENKINPLSVVSSDWFYKFFRQEPYISEKQLDEVISKCKNAQDAVIFQLLFEGVNGYGKSELLNLRVSDVDFINNTLNLIDDKYGPRKLPVSNKCIELIRQARKETVYYEKNGQSKARSPYVPLNEGQYIIRNSKRRSADNKGKADKHIIHRRLTAISEVFKLPYSRAKFIEQSGMIKTAKEVYEELGRIDEDKALSKIYERFRKKKIIVGKWEVNNPSLKEFVSSETIFNVYGIEFHENIDPFILVDESEKEQDNSDEAKVRRRVKQDMFREMILNNYNKRCVITGEDTQEVLEAAHIQRYINDNSHHPQNGLILRVDFHKLFDSGLITISDNYKVVCSSQIRSNYYRKYDGLTINLPKNEQFRPSKEALEYHRKKYGQGKVDN